MKQLTTQRSTQIVLLLSLSFLMALTGCKSYWVAAHIVNQTGAPVRELEVDYPSASFGTNALADGATMNYRFKIRGSGPIVVGYTAPDGKIAHVEGLRLLEEQWGDLTIVLLPQGKVDFQPRLSPAS